MIFGSYGRSETGPRSHNEDSFGIVSVSTDGVIAAIADGVGGRRAGHVASRVAVDEFIAMMTESIASNPVEVVAEVNQKILLKQEENRKLVGMSTTFTGFIILDGFLRGAHAGDSRAVLLRRNGAKRLTEDHTEVNRLLKAGMITKSEAASYPRKNIIESALGVSGDTQIDGIDVRLEVGDRILLTTDGVHGKVFLKEIRDMSLRCRDAESFVDVIMSTVKMRSPEDNYTCVCIEVLR